MNKLLSIVLVLFCSTSFAAELIKDIAYYPKDFPGSGDLEYRAERCQLDVCIPDKDAGEKLPTIVWFHGGGLSGGGKHIIADFTNHKIIVVAVNYRLLPKANKPDFIEDAAAAVAWTFENIEKHGGDKAKIYVSGHSAGGYLATMIGMAPQHLARHQLKNTDVAAIYSVSGQATTHFALVAAALAEQGKTKPANFGRDNPIVIDEFAPLRYTDQKLPPLHLLCGDPKVEWPARVEENALMAAMIRTVTDHNVIEFRSYPNTNHGSCLAPSVDYIWKSIRGVKE
ncbi:MAG TPA: alpha/beta hydrolase [Pirellulaceae bacterium]|nr:alpha/beta hydrolase [Pirellulaceae bacterium]